MTLAGRTFVVRQLSEQNSDEMLQELARLERIGHKVADVRHEDGSWRIYAYDRRFHQIDSFEPVGVLAFRRRATD